jgi:hypothetical protein
MDVARGRIKSEKAQDRLSIREGLKAHCEEQGYEAQTDEIAQQVRASGDAGLDRAPSLAAIQGMGEVIQASLPAEGTDAYDRSVLDCVVQSLVDIGRRGIIASSLLRPAQETARLAIEGRLPGSEPDRHEVHEVVG